MMTPQQVREFVEREIHGRWHESNLHGVNLRTCLVTPRRVKMINRRVVDGDIVDSTVEVWVVLEETPGETGGYTIFFDEEDRCFGLASPGFKEDSHPVICGYYGDFWTTLKGM